VFEVYVLNILVFFEHILLYNEMCYARYVVYVCANFRICVQMCFLWMADAY
jgi:hypothetical protein